MADLAKVYEAARNRGAVFDFSSRARWRLSGPDRVRFLNGQVTNDVRRVPPDGLLPACVTTAKGKLSGVILISAWPGALCLDAEPGQREALTARLERYIIADDVLLEDITGQECLFHVRAAGPPAVPEGATLRHATRLGAPGFDIAAPAGEQRASWPGCSGKGWWRPVRRWRRRCGSRPECHAGARNWTRIHCRPKPGWTASPSITTRAATSGRRSFPASRAWAT